jgi:hypothetical protein
MAEGGRAISVATGLTWGEGSTISGISIVGVGGEVGEGFGKFAVGDDTVKGGTTSAGVHPARTRVVRTIIKLRMGL